MTVFATMFGLFGSPNDPFFELGTKFKRQYVTEGMQVVFIPVADREEIPALSTGMTAVKSDGSEVKLNIIGDDDEFPDDDATLNVSLLSDSEGGVVAENAWYSFRLPLGRSVLAASMTLMLVILPVVIISTQEALRAVPTSLRQGAQGLGCTPWQTVRNVTLPAAIPGIMTGCILSMSRAIGEAAPILMISGIVAISMGPQHLMDDFSILPLQIYYWAGQPVNDADPHNFQHVAAGAIIVLLLVLFAFNSVAILLRQVAQKKLS
jgi:phosphate transport system permease protein